jgi:hypothetical protein
MSAPSGSGALVPASSVASWLRSASSISGSSATRFLGSARAAASNTPKCSPSLAMVASSKRSVLYSKPPASSPEGSSATVSVRSNFAVPLSVSSGESISPGKESGGRGAFCSTNIT